MIVCYTRWRHWPIICGFSAFFNREPQQWICAINVEFNNSSCTWDVRRHRVYYRGLRVTLIAACRVTAVQAYWHFQYHRHSQLPTFPVYMYLTLPVWLTLRGDAELRCHVQKWTLSLRVTQRYLLVQLVICVWIDCAVVTRFHSAYACIYVFRIGRFVLFTKRKWFGLILWLVSDQSLALLHVLHINYQTAGLSLQFESRRNVNCHMYNLFICRHSVVGFLFFLEVRSVLLLY